MNGSGLSPSRTLVTSFNPKTTTASQLNASQHDESADYFEEGDWVLCVTSSSSVGGASPWLGCALSNGEIQVYDQTRLLSIQTFHHDALITDLVRDASNPHHLIASAADGTVSIYDVRQSNQPACQVKLPRPEEEALSVSMGFDGAIAAVGSNKAKVHFFDIRDTRSVLGTYNQAHTNEITRVRFQTVSSPGAMTTTTPILVSAAEDGLACVYDTSQASEEAAIQNILAVQSPIREIGFFGPQSDAIYCLTGSENLMLYHKDDSVCRKDFGPNLRSILSQQLSSSLTPNNGSTAVSIDYLVDCHWDAARQELQLLAGNAQGGAAVYQVGEQGLCLQNRLNGGHRGVVRAWNALSNNVFVTVGEDARICEWNRISNAFGAGSGSVPSSLLSMPQNKSTEILVGNAASSMHRNMGPLSRPGGGKMRRPRSRMTASPY
jgi:WD40 repeat protein